MPVRKKKPVARKAAAQAVRVPTAKIANMHSRYFDVRQSGIQGKGAFARTRIRKGQRIIEYAGERISNDEADSRYDETGMKRHHTFLFTLTSRKVVDGAVNGNESIYINHSCDPNCEAVIEDDRIFIEAVRTIQPGEELAYDYQYERTGENDEEMEKFYKCLCGAPNCRGSILKAKPAPRRKKTSKRAAKR
ncbi:MAG: SET domain-containing protein-lysine N-methyltransferase [Gemmatimonadota bacterium]